MTNENTKPADEMKDVAAGNIPHPVSQAPDPQSADNLRDVAAGNVPHPYSGSSPQSVPGDPSINPPGTTIEVADLNKAAAGVNATADAGPVDTGNPISDPPYDPQPGRQSSAANAG